MSERDVVVVGMARTAIGSFGASLKDIPLTRLGTVAVTAALKRSGVDPAEVGHVVMGNVVPTEPRDAYLSRVAAMDSGIPNGSGISLGHPVGATGAIITTKAIYELHRTRGRYALVTMCIGGGQGIAAVFERL